MDVRARTTLPPSAGTPAAARAIAREAVAGSRPEARVEDVELVVSELVTQAVVNGDGDVTLVVAVDDDAVQVEVADAGPVTPAPRRDGQPQGLMLVSRVASRWGVRRDEAGKTVWAYLAC